MAVRSPPAGRRSGWGGGVVVGGLGTIALLTAAALAVVWSGAYNVAATEPHTSPVRWMLDTALQRSVRQRAGDGAAVAMDDARLASGARAYRAMCQHCHAAPGVERASWAEGMRPKPPKLAEAASRWSVEEIRWIVEHGIRMTGMPAFGPSHSAAETREIAAFVSQLPRMTPARYAALAPPTRGGDAHAAEHGGASKSSNPSK